MTDEKNWLCASLCVQTYGILTVLTSESARVSDFSPHVIFAVSWHRICDLTEAMIKLYYFQLVFVI